LDIFYGFNGFEGMIAFFSIQTIGYAIALLLGLFWSKSENTVHQEKPLGEVWKSVQWFAILAFVMSIFTRIDSYMISIMAPDTFADAGVYAKSFRLLDASLIFSALLSTLLLPNFSKLISKRKHKSAGLTRVKIILTIAYPLFIGLFYAPQVMERLYHTGDNLQSNQTFVLSWHPFYPWHWFMYLELFSLLPTDLKPCAFMRLSA